MFGIPIELLLGMITGIISFFGKMSANKQADNKELMELALKQNTQDNSNADSASQRSTPFVRKMIAGIVIITSIGGLLLVALFPSIPTTMLIDGVTTSYLWGLFTHTSTPTILAANGFFLADFMRYAVYQIIGYSFGSAVGKASR